MDLAIENTAPKPPASSRFNFRILAFALLVVALVGVPVYSVISETLTHGIHHVGGNTYEVDLKALGNFEFDGRTGTIEDIPARFRKLDGKRVVMAGYPTLNGLSAGASNEFQFVYNVYICCFGGPPKVQERVFAYLPKGLKLDFLEEDAQLTGILHVKIVRDEGVVTQVYSLDVESVNKRR